MGDSALRLLQDSQASLPSSRHVGVLVPWANTVVEAELPLLGGGKVTWHYARLVPDSHSTRLDDGFLAGLMRSVPPSMDQLSRLPLAVAYVACTSAGFSFPDALKGTGESETRCPVFTAFDAILAALRLLNSTDIVLVTPYQPRLTDREAQAFARCGITVLAHRSLGIDDDFAAIRPAAITRYLDEVPAMTLASADAVVLSCTAWPTLGMIEDLERRLQRPVVSSNLALAIAATVEHV